MLETAMPRVKKKLPTYRFHKPSGQGVVSLSGRTHYLGKFESPRSRAEYERLLGLWLMGGRRPLQPPGSNCPPTAGLPGVKGSAPAMASHGIGPSADLRIVELLAGFRRYAAEYYSLEGRPTSEYCCYRAVIRTMRKQCGHLQVQHFGPLALMELRERFIEARQCRDTVNRNIGRVRRIFRWGVEREMVSPTVLQGLQAVSGLKAGRTAAHEGVKVLPVIWSDVKAIRPHVSAQVWAAIELQWLTGMRPGEVLTMRGGDMETGADVWLYRPASHKNAWRGQPRIVDLGPQAQQVIKPFLTGDPAAYLFSAAQAVKAKRAKQRKDRKTPLYPSHVRRLKARRKRRPRRTPHARYTVGAYRRAIARACQAAGCKPWHPHQLRHSAGTRIRKEYGIEAAKIILGHQKLNATEIYAEADREKARKIVKKLG
jgi:integrase